MATAKVSELFRAHYLADRIRGKMVVTRLFETEEGMTYEHVVVCARLSALLQNCDMEVELSPESEQLINPVLEKIRQPRTRIG